MPLRQPLVRTKQVDFGALRGVACIVEVQVSANMSDQLLRSVAFALCFSGFGLFFVFGAYRRWKWLVDPPTFLWFCYTQSFFKLIAGVEGCRIISILLGIVLFGAGMNLLFSLLAGVSWL